MDDKKIEKLLQNLANESLPDDIAALAEQKSKQFSRKIAEQKQNVWTIIMQSKMTKIAAAAVIIIAISLFFMQREQSRETKTPQMTKTAKSPAELLTMASLNLAYRHGGMQAMEKQFDKAEKKVKPGLKTRLTVDQLICELNGC